VDLPLPGWAETLLVDRLKPPLVGIAPDWRGFYGIID
jgi:hypothetical protein